jgi:hypothetical protein
MNGRLDPITNLLRNIFLMKKMGIKPPKIVYIKTKFKKNCEKHFFIYVENFLLNSIKIIYIGQSNICELNVPRFIEKVAKKIAKET